ncbi:MAG: PAS domain-containing protein, partial [Actinomycetota bacterium]
MIDTWNRAREERVEFSAEYRMFHKDGHEVWIRDDARQTGHSDEGYPLWQGVMYNITDRVAAETDLRESERKFRALVEEIPAITYIEEWRHGGPGNPLRYVSPQIEQIWGVSPEARMQDPMLWERALHPDDRERALAEDQGSNETGELFDITYRLVRPDERIVWIREHTRLVRDADGNPDFWLGVMFDMTDQKALEADLESRSAELRSLGEIDRAILSARSSEEVVREAIGRLRALVACAAVTVAGYDGQEPAWRILAATGPLVEGVQEGTRIPIESGPLLEVLLAGDPLYMPDLNLIPDPPEMLAAVRDRGTRSLLVVPMLADEALLG